LFATLLAFVALDSAAGDVAVEGIVVAVAEGIAEARRKRGLFRSK
jgi:hypothetical protein